MKINPQIKAQALEVYQRYWESYTKGDLETFASTLDETFEMIGTSESERCHTKADGIEFLKAQLHEIVGKAEMRNRQIDVLPVENLILVNEQCDIYVLLDSEWNFYSKIRISTLLRETKDGWKVTQQHGSLPDMRVGEGETIALEKISKENLELRDAVKRRTAELENKNRELAIEAALEKVRAVAMGMKKPEDMLDVCRVISEQLELFGVEKIRNVQTAIIDENLGQYLCYQYFTPYENTAVEITEYLKSPVEHGMVEQMLASRDGYFIGGLYGRELEEFREHRKVENHFLDPFLDEAKELAYCFLSIGEGGLGLTLYQPMADDILILFKRFHQVFSLAYKRFRDIQKAEAHARENEIELALERVRAMTMAMRNSDDMGNCIVKMFSELTALGVDEGTRFGIGILNQDNENNQLWTAKKDGEEVKMHIGNLDMASHPLLKSARKAWKDQIPFHRYVLEGEDLLDYYQMLNNAPDYKIQIHLEQLPEREIQHCFIFEHGFFYAFSPREFQPELIHLTQRFSSQFAQTYRRYMDLQKAEAQAREAQIQLSLERIRAKAMAMQHSDELGDFLTVVFEQFEVLNLNPVFCHLSFFDIENNRFTYRMTGRTGAAVIATQEIDLEATPLWKQNVEDWKSGHPYQVGGLYIPKERIPEMTEIFNEILSKLPEEERPKIEDFPNGQYVVDGYCKYGYLGYSASRPPSDEEKEITRGIANEFGNVYQRFIDLQKAETQAREAQIQLSLERIRAKAMSMQHSDELSDFLTVVFEQFEVLNLNPVNCHLAFLDIENNRSIFRLTGKSGATLIATQEINLDASPVWTQKVEAWKSGRFTDVDVLFVPFEKLPEIGEIFKEILDKIPENDRPLPEDYPDGQYVVDGYCKYGYLGYSASRPPSDEEKEITRRIANEFGNVYQRFLDLEKAEAQVREAQIQLSLERIRAKAMAMQHTDELSDFLSVLFEQFEVLKLHPVYCHLSLLDIENNRTTFRTTGKKGATLIATQEIDFYASPIWKQKIEDWKAGNPYDVDVMHIPYESLPEMAEIFKEIRSKLPEEDLPQQDDFPNGQYVVEGYCKYGYLGYGAIEPPSEEEKEITRRISTEFGNVYQRFIDLQKAETQAREAQIQLSLERIRAKAIAMQHSDELSDFLTVVFEQFEVLNLSPVSCQLSFFDIENNRSTFRMTSKNGSALIATQEVDLDASPLWKKKVMDWKTGHPNDVDVLYIPFENLPEIVEIFKEIRSKLPEDELPQIADFPNGQYVVEGYCKYGYLGYIASRPPSDEEKEITRRIANEFGNVYQRFLDLEKAEAQTREAQIQLSLERIRAKAMSMQHSDELSDFLTVVFEQFEVLNLSPVNCILSLYDIENNRSTFRMTGKNGATLIATQEIDLDASPVWKKKIEDFKLGHPNDVDVLFIPYERLPEIAEIFKEIIGKLPEDERPKIEEDYPNGEYVIDGYCKYGYLGYSASRPPSDEEKEITRRIANEFGNVYQRFIDLQKAEAQAIEAQIEAALERVRSRTMAMQHSDELTEVAGLLFNQVSALGIKTWTTGFNVWSEDNDSYVDYLSFGKGFIEPNTVHTEKAEALRDVSNARKSGVEFEVLYVEGEKIKQLYLAISGIDEKQYDIMLKDGLLPSHQYEHFVFGSKVSLMFITYEPVPEAHDIFKRLGKVFEQTYTRFLDLQRAEAQAREGQIQLALERVRARTMAMQKSQELPEAANLLFQQIQSLGMPAWSAGYCTWNEDQPTKQAGKSAVTLWMSSEGVLQPPFIAPTTEDKLFIQMREGAENGWDLHVVEMGGEELDQHYRYMRSLPVVGEILDSIIEAGHPLPTFQIMHQAYFSKGFLLFITYESVPEAYDIFKRFAKVFDQTYTRFLDLQKAEAQARESQVQLALERVRARTMAMQKSDELAEVSYLLNKQVVELGILTRGCAFSIYNEYDSTEWFSDLEGTLPPYKTPREYIFQKYYEAGQRGETLLIDEFSGDRIRELYQYFASRNNSGNEAIDNHLAKAPEYQINHMAYFKYGYLLFITLAPAPEAHDVFKRFSKEFEQTYTRFLDLKKAEAQARESEIEVALEKVRSRSLAMHKSDELKDVVFTVFERLRDLQIQTDSTNIVVYHDESEKMEFWTANDMNYATKFSLPMTGRFYPIEGIEARNEQKFFLQHLPFEEKNRFWEELFQTTDFRKVPEERKNFLLEKTDCLIQLVAFGKLTGIMLNRHFNTPFSDAEIEIAERFAKVFDQAYTRFLDLQKAEKQAREAQIEAALEKVRSRSLAMQSPDELIEVAQLLREEMGALGVEELETSSIYIHDASSGLTECWFTIKNTANPAKAVTDQMTIRLEDTWVGRQMREFFHSSAEKASIVMRGENRLEWIHYCEEKTNLFGTSNFYGDTIPDRTYHLYKFSNGYFGAAAPGEISQESWDLLRRATAVFSFAYTRFQDLQNAQASARAAMRQASLDRIRADISSMRNADDLDRITPLIFKELTVLGVPFIRCGVFIINEKQELVEAYLSSPDGNSLGVLRLPYQASELTFQTVKAWRKGEIYKQHWNKEDFIQWINQLMEQDQIQDSSTYQGTAVPPESLDLHFVPFTQGMLYVGGVNPLEENELELVQALAKAFSIAYARYEDFVKLENAKAEVEAAMRELKATQTQLVQQEKLASLGQLTAGIAHEIKNPLNFVNNFSEVSMELIEEALEEIAQIEDNKHAIESAEILTDIKSNLTKIHEHGTRANGIVSSMLQHSRGGTGKMEPTDLNALIKEYVNLSFHGMRAGKNPIDVEIALELDEEITEVPLIKEDFSRVIINLCNNAFDAMRGKVNSEFRIHNSELYHPKLTIHTKSEKDHILISVADNGPGIPDDIKDKILQPFFTTKKGTEGTGLGLSITHDIVKAHGGEIRVESEVGNGTEFVIQIQG